MCRLFALSGGPRRVRATFWLLDAPDSLAAQSRRNPDGYGLGFFDEDGSPVVDKRPRPAYADREFGREAREVRSRITLAHVRHASTGILTAQNTHPFVQCGRLFAHNGVVEGLAAIEARLTPSARARVLGESDSERVFALITQEIEARGDVRDGIAAAAEWLAASVPIYSLNFVLATPTELWAVRYPEANELWLLEREAGGRHRRRGFEGASATTRVRSTELGACPSVVLASEPMDEHPGWRALASGELLRVGADLTVARAPLLEAPPAHPLSLADLSPVAARSQAAAA